MVCEVGVSHAIQIRRKCSEYVKSMPKSKPSEKVSHSLYDVENRNDITIDGS